MELFLHESGIMTGDSNSIFRGLQNYDMPLLDLFVRESLQNSLDAANANEEEVPVLFDTGSFSNERLASHFSGIDLLKKFGKKEYKFLTVQDYKTKGLSGPACHADVKGNQYGNFQKLVYQIQKPQENTGAGGSHGLGKTIYFRLGLIGLVIFYTRIKKENGEFETRLAAAFAEDIKTKDPLLPKKENGTGLAWWGKTTVRNSMNYPIPLINDNEIDEILEIFGIAPYKGTKTGTVIIVPYINENDLAINGLSKESDNKLFWHSSVNEYLRIAIPRWYNPRLNNLEYPYGASLKVKVGNEKVDFNSAPLFGIVSDLYYAATLAFKGKSLGIENIHCETINIRKNTLTDKSIAGIFAFKEYSKADFDLTTFPDPYSYINKQDLFLEASNRPIIGFVRSPGMIVDYITSSKNFETRVDSDKDHFIIGIFVLNSNNKLRDSELTLEEYIRGGELSDHNKWDDRSVFYNNTYDNPEIVKSIFKLISKKLSQTFSQKKTSSEATFSGSLANYYGQKLLPPMGYGKGTKAKAEEDKQPRVGGGRGTSKTRFTIFSDKMQFEKNFVKLPASLKLNAECLDFNFELAIKTENDSIPLTDWLDVYKNEKPFELLDIRIKSKGQKKWISFLDSNGEILSADFTATKKKTNEGTFIGLNMQINSTEIKEIDFEIIINVINKSLRPDFKNSAELDGGQ